MKKIILALFSFSACLCLNAQHSPNDGHNHTTVTPGTNTEEVLKFKETEHNFDKIPQGKPVYYTFDITNTSKTALKLDDVHASCGCTTPEWSREAIEPGATAKIRVGYNAAAEGYFEKNITITYNSNQTKQIIIKGTVWKAPEGSAPANASIDFLKKQSF
ncbi:MAG: DUF1573 domain-containing protein [Chitinophagaceae bacterium]|jgi:hypothetical protein|nr:DUF1573 domain-containing protein [Chitinophagaceae bacterium]MBK8300602.1 DUF1573 domain-containing protein [Chitinophagaceae bacterium]MBK9465104.1 DUF1573 domain-containing protein [Chitinophagaceae bacterium]MBK9660899.1 DUF1573 domain-containing protein [Chitinophagaceae bacterium]MBK9939452.1 DUF1573 domain-containing protein [Chitinophagaceae bacterium]